MILDKHKTEPEHTERHNVFLEGKNSFHEDVNTP